MPGTASAPVEKTFSSFNKEQGQNYAQHRRGYHQKLLKVILDHHTSTGGQLDTLLDVGCGPGIATSQLAPHFIHAIGLDPSEGMISTARSLGGLTSTSEPIRYDISTAEALGSNISPPIANSSIDMVTAATAAHWFDMSGFWPSAARVLKPGGTVAIWCIGSYTMDSTMTNGDAIQAAVDEWRKTFLAPYFVPGNFLTRDLYRNLPLPWTLPEHVEEFEQSTFFRQEWDANSLDNESLEGKLIANMDKMEGMLGTTGPVQRWREAHPDTLGTEKDVVRILRREIERLLHEVGVEEGKEMVQGHIKMVLLMVKKKA